MNAMRWTRAKAIDFIMQNTAMAENNLVNEVDRYITRSGKALACTTGQLEMIRLSQNATRRPGERFDIREFHDVLLRDGAVPLNALREVVEPKDANRMESSSGKGFLWGLVGIQERLRLSILHSRSNRHETL